MRELLKSNCEEEWHEENINRDSLDQLKKKYHCHGLRLILEKDPMDSKCELLLKNKMQEWLYEDVEMTTDERSSEDDVSTAT